MLSKRRRQLTLLCVFTSVTLLLTIFLLNAIRPIRPAIQLLQKDIPPSTNAQLPPSPHVQSHPVCKFITKPSGEWSYNSRSLCSYPRACISNLLHLPPESPSCELVTPTLRRQPAHPSFNCTSQWTSRVTCAYTSGLVRNAPSCTPPLPFPENATFQEVALHNAVFVPRYPFPANIYHFANTVTTLAHVLSYNPGGNITIIFHFARRIPLPWQNSFLDVMLNRIRALYEHVNVHYLQPGETICAEKVLILGTRGHVNVWPFPNTTAVNPFAKEVPVDSIAFRKSFYKAYDIPVRLPDEKDLIVDTPPLVLGYSRRLGPGASTGGNVHAIGTARRFSDDDEAWFQQMLRDETDAFGIELRLFTTSAGDSLQEQVTNFATLGAVIGIHGANLVNSIFMPPLSALIEIFPTGTTSTCYYAGSNSGHRYIRFESDDPATAEESDCTAGRCLKLVRQRRVKIGREEERTRLRDAVRQGLTYLIQLKERYPQGVPVREDADTGMYQVGE